ncbi:MAG: DNA polymerase I [Candidatus Hydrogenedens sp.]|nr:DNA polymerase I [Candidatus Hydrogenedens sp.]
MPQQRSEEAVTGKRPGARPSPPMPETIFIIDAMAYAFRSYFAIRAALTDSRGRPTNAVYGFARVLIKILREHNPSHIAVVFDAPGKTFRDELYADYKSTRQETPDELKAQFPIMHELVEALDLPLYVVPGVEADDVIGTLARQAEAAGMEPVLVSADKDLLQLVTAKTRMFDPNKGDAGQWYGENEVRERFGTPPAHVADALALIGDTADNIPGVRGIGDKTAKKLMETYGTLEGLYERIGELKGKQRENLEQDKDQAFFSRTLATIKTDVPLDRSVDTCGRGSYNEKKLVDMLTALEFHSLIEEFMPKAGAATESLDYQLVLDRKQLDAMLAQMRKSGRFAFDTETTDVDPMRAHLVGMSFSCAPNTGFYIPLAHTREALCIRKDPDDLTSIEELHPLPMQDVLDAAKPLLEDPAIGKIGHNIKYDLVVMRRAGIELRGIDMDTMIASHLTDPSRLRHNLDEVSLQHLRRKLTPISELIGKGAKAVTFDHVSVDLACDYACEDADAAWQLSGIFSPPLEERDLSQLFHEVEIPLIGVLADMEMAGIAIDATVFEELRQEIETKLAALEREIHALAKHPFNINSPKQLQEVLFTELGLKPTRKTKTGYSTDMDVLEQLASEHELPAKVVEYRGLDKLRGTYVEALPKLVHPETGRIHTSFNQAVAATGRLSSSDPNLQNIPVRTDYGRRIREGFIPGGPGRVLLSADYSQIELRVLAHLSGDKALSQAFFDDADIHRDTASRVFGVKPEDVTPDMRRQAKAVNFGVVYGQTAFGLARSINVSNKEAEKFITAYFEQYPGVRAWLDNTIEEGTRLGYVKTMLGRRRYVPDLQAPNQAVRRAAERVAINTPVQGSAADIIKVAMLRLAEALKAYDAQLLLQVHDELVVEADAKHADDVMQVMRHTMENAAKLDVPLKVDAGVGKNWAEIH